MSGACSVPVGDAESECEKEPVADQTVKQDGAPAVEAPEGVASE